MAKSKVASATPAPQPASRSNLPELAGPEWDRAVRYLARAYRTRDLDAGMNWDCLLNFALASAASIAQQMLRGEIATIHTAEAAEAAEAAEPSIVTPEDTLRAAGVSGKRQAAYQRKMSALLAAPPPTEAK